MKTFTVLEYAQANGLYRQLAAVRLKNLLSKGIIKPAERLKVVRSKEVSTYEFRDGSELDLVPSKPMLKVVLTDYRFFSDPFNRTGWRQS